MKKLVLLLACIVGCASSPDIKNSCSELEAEGAEAVMDAYQEAASLTSLCTGLLGDTFNAYYTTDSEQEKHYYRECKEMPAIVHVECFRNCTTNYTGCLVFHADGYTMEVVASPKAFVDNEI